MEDTQSVASLMNSTSSKILQLQKAFAELESHRALTLNWKWKELEEHFHGLEKSLKRRFDELEDQEKVLEDKALKSREMLEKREAAVLAKEKASLERLQKKRDAAVMEISTSLKRHRKVSSGYLDGGGEPKRACIDDEKASSDDTTTAVSCVEDPEDPSECDEVNSSPPQLDTFCKDMDSEGLHKFISDNRKNLAAIREEVPLALRAAPSPAGFVLRCLADFYSTDRPKFDGKKDSDLLGLRRTSIMLLECLSILLTDNNLAVSDIITEDVKLQAKAIAEEWKPKLASLDMGSSNGNSLEAHAFLQLLATFGIAADYEEEFLSRLVPTVSRRRQTADLCLSLGLASKMPGVIKELISSGRHIDAVNLSFAFGLTEQYAPLPLLKSYLNEARKAASPVKPGSSISGAQVVEVNERELSALKAVIRCVEEHRLEGQYPLDAIRKEVLALEKAKAEKKQTVAEVPPKPQPKRPRANVIIGNGGHPPISPSAAGAPIKTFYPTFNERYPPYVYERPYIYPGAMENHGPPLVGAAPYNMPLPPPPPGHGNFFGNVYHYQAPPHQYLH